MGPNGRHKSISLFFFIFYFISTSSFSAKYNGYKLYRVHLPPNVGTEKFVRWLERMEQKLNELSTVGQSICTDNAQMTLLRHQQQQNYQSPLLDIWTLPNDLHRNADILLAPSIEKAFISALCQGTTQRESLRVELLREDIQKDIDSEKNEMIRRKRLWRMKRRRRRGEETREGQKRHGAHQNGGGGRAPAAATIRQKWKHAMMDLNTYNSYSAMEQYLNKIVAQNPQVAELVNLTKTFEGRDLLAVRIGHREDSNEHSPRQVVYIDAGVHAREWIAPAAALYLIDKLISLWNKPLPHNNYRRHSSDANPSPLFPSASSSPSSSIDVSVLRQFEFVIVPCANPDGYAFSMSRDRLWRKTRSRNETLHKWCVGADANRNWGYRWAETGASRSPCSNIYPGQAPFSEPEVKAVKDYLSPELSRLVAYISLHSYGQLVLSPWGFSTAKPSNHDEQQKLAALVIDSIRENTGTEYTFGTIADLLYPASGTSIDYWQYRGVPYIYGVELRPEDVESEIHGFAIAPEQIEPSGEEVFTMVKKIVEYVSEKKNRRPLNEIGREKALDTTPKFDNLNLSH